MAQHDYVIDNSTGANVRADINSVLQAIASNNSGSSAPSTTVASQFFADTNAGIMKLRNTSNNGYVNLFTLAGGIDVDAASNFNEDVTFTGANYNLAWDKSDNQLEFADNARATFGGSNDLRIFHTGGANSHISNLTNNLIIQTPNRVEIGSTDTNGSATEISAKFIRNGSVEIYYDNSKKFETLNTGCAVTGSLGIGTTSPSSYNSSFNDLVIQGSSNQGITIATTDTSSLCQIGFADGTSGDAQFRGLIRYDHSSDHFALYTAGFNERFRINSSGFFQYNNTVDIGGVFQLTANGVVNLAGNKLARFNYNSTGDVTGIEMRHARGGLSGFSGKIISFTGNDGTEEGSININVTSTSYNTSSDYRLKENETAISDGIVKLKQLKPYRFNFKKDPDVKVDGFFAHEVASVVPNAVTGEKDAMEAETRYEVGDTIPEGKVIGDPKTFSTTTISPQQLDHSKLVPLLVAAVQELIGKVEALEAA